MQAALWGQRERRASRPRRAPVHLLCRRLYVWLSVPRCVSPWPPPRLAGRDGPAGGATLRAPRLTRSAMPFEPERRVAETAARAAAAFIRENAGRVSERDVRAKTVHDLVTFVDEGAQRIILERPRRRLPRRRGPRRGVRHSRRGRRSPTDVAPRLGARLDRGPARRDDQLHARRPAVRRLDRPAGRRRGDHRRRARRGVRRAVRRDARAGPDHRRRAGAGIPRPRRWTTRSSRRASRSATTRTSRATSRRSRP